MPINKYSVKFVDFAGQTRSAPNTVFEAVRIPLTLLYVRKGLWADYCRAGSEFMNLLAN